VTQQELCPWCYDEDKCHGPHIKPEHVPRYWECIRIERDFVVGEAIDAILSIPMTDGKLARIDVITKLRSLYDISAS